MIEANPMTAFLVSASGNWRNAIFIDCSSCKRIESPCGGVLMIPDPEAKPTLVAADDLSRMLGCGIEKEECAAIITAAQFESLYAAWLLWEVDDAKACPLRWLTKHPLCMDGHC